MEIEKITSRIKGQLKFIIITVFSGFAGLLLCQIILPSFVSSLRTTLATLEIVDAANIISWAAILLTFFGLMLSLIIMSRDYRYSSMLIALVVTFLFSVFFLCVGSQLYLIINHPQVFEGSNQFVKFMKFYSYPTLISLVIEDPEPIWLISTVLFLTLFNSSFYYLTEAL